MTKNADEHEAYERGRRDEREACAALADAFADENLRMAQDTILIDPVLAAHRQGTKLASLAEADWNRAKDLMVEGCVHSSMFHAAQNIAQAIRGRK